MDRTNDPSEGTVGSRGWREFLAASFSAFIAQNAPPAYFPTRLAYPFHSSVRTATPVDVFRPCPALRPGAFPLRSGGRGHSRDYGPFLEAIFPLKLTFVAERPHPPQIAYQEVLMAAEPGGDHFS